MPKTVTLRVDDDTYDAFLKRAKDENRSVANFIEHAVKTHIQPRLRGRRGNGRDPRERPAGGAPQAGVPGGETEEGEPGWLGTGSSKRLGSRTISRSSPGPASAASTRNFGHRSIPAFEKNPISVPTSSDSSTGILPPGDTVSAPGVSSMKSTKNTLLFS